MVSTEVLTEFYAVVTRKLAVPVPVLASKAEATVLQLSTLPVVAVDASLVAAALAAVASGRCRSGMP